MPWYEYVCGCSHKYDVIEFGSEIEKKHLCEKCGKEMERAFCPSGNFTLKYNPEKDKVSWGSEGYATTQRHKGKKDGD